MGTGSSRDVKTHRRAGLSNNDFADMVRRCAENEQITIKQARLRVLEVLRNEEVGKNPVPETIRVFNEAREKGVINTWEPAGRYTSTAESLLPLDLSWSP
jgi:hypothetical protein